MGGLHFHSMERVFFGKPCCWGQNLIGLRRCYIWLNNLVRWLHIYTGFTVFLYIFSSEYYRYITQQIKATKLRVQFTKNMHTVMYRKAWHIISVVPHVSATLCHYKLHTDYWLLVIASLLKDSKDLPELTDMIVQMYHFEEVVISFSSISESIDSKNVTHIYDI